MVNDGIRQLIKTTVEEAVSGAMAEVIKAIEESKFYTGTPPKRPSNKIAEIDYADEYDRGIRTKWLLWLDDKGNWKLHVDGRAKNKGNYQGLLKDGELTKCHELEYLQIHRPGLYDRLLYELEMYKTPKHDKTTLRNEDYIVLHCVYTHHERYGEYPHMDDLILNEVVSDFSVNLHHAIAKLERAGKIFITADNVVNIMRSSDGR